MIKVTYDGEYPNACSGTLTIIVDGETIYSKKYCCTSTGNCYFTEDWDGVVEEGTLEWEDKDSFSKEIVNAVYEELSKVYVCCGGCL